MIPKKEGQQAAIPRQPIVVKRRRRILIFFLWTYDRKMTRSSHGNLCTSRAHTHIETLVKCNLCKCLSNDTLRQSIRRKTFQTTKTLLMLARMCIDACIYMQRRCVYVYERKRMLFEQPEKVIMHRPNDFTSLQTDFSLCASVGIGNTFRIIFLKMKETSHSHTLAL